MPKDERAIPVFPAVCPSCRQSVDFCLIKATKVGTAGRIFQVLFGTVMFEHPPRKSIACQHCSHNKILTSAQYAEAESLSIDYAKLLSNELSNERYFQVLTECKIPFIQEILTYKPDWSCKHCGEVNPPNFNICFNCQWENPAVARNINAGNLPHIGGGHPWEQ